MQRTDDVLQEMLTVKEYLPPYASVLMLNFSHHGKDAKGIVLNEKTVVFLHAHQYSDIAKEYLLQKAYL